MVKEKEVRFYACNVCGQTQLKKIKPRKCKYCGSKGDHIKRFLTELIK